MNTMEKIWVMNCPKCSQELPQGLRKKEILPTINVNCLRCGWKGSADKTTHRQITFEEWMGGSDYSEYDYNKERMGMSAEQFSKMYEEEVKSGKVSLDNMAFKNNQVSPEQPSTIGEFIGEIGNNFSEEQLNKIIEIIDKINKVDVDDPETVNAWHGIKHSEGFNPELKKKWEEALAKKDLK